MRSMEVQILVVESFMLKKREYEREEEERGLMRGY
jgi:hypothetical protein